MTTLIILLIVVLAAIETLASYISRVYSEFGKILTHEIENLVRHQDLPSPPDFHGIHLRPKERFVAIFSRFSCAPTREPSVQ